MIKRLLSLSSIALLLIVVSCGGGGNDSSTGAGSGTTTSADTGSVGHAKHQAVGNWYDGLDSRFQIRDDGTYKVFTEGGVFSGEWTAVAADQINLNRASVKGVGRMVTNDRIEFPNEPVNHCTKTVVVQTGPNSTTTKCIDPFSSAYALTRQ